MKFLTFLPLIAAALALSLMFISPPPAEARWGFGGHSQGRGYDNDGGRADINHNFDQAHQKWTPNSFDSRPRQLHGSRRDPVTGIWRPYR